MQGTVKSYSSATMYGFITNDSDEMFFFLKSEWHLPMKPQKGLLVEFKPVDTEKGRRATDIQMARRP